MVKFITPPTSQAILSDLGHGAKLIKIFIFLRFSSRFWNITDRGNLVSLFFKKINSDRLSFKNFHFKWGKFRNWIFWKRILMHFLTRNQFFRHRSKQNTQESVFETPTERPLSFLNEENDTRNRYKNEFCTYTATYLFLWTIRSNQFINWLG